MICFRDRTWCNRICGNLDCRANFTAGDREQASVWWGDDNFPISMQDKRTETCGYIEVVDVQE